MQGSDRVEHRAAAPSGGAHALHRARSARPGGRRRRATPSRGPC